MVVRGPVELISFRGFGESTLSNRRFRSRTPCCVLARKASLRDMNRGFMSLFGGKGTSI